MDRDKLLANLDELEELIEIHPRNSLNLCLCGGMETLLNIMLENPIEEARRLGCSVFSQAVQNKP